MVLNPFESQEKIFLITRDLGTHMKTTHTHTHTILISSPSLILFMQMLTYKLDMCILVALESVRKKKKNLFLCSVVYAY